MTMRQRHGRQPPVIAERLDNLTSEVIRTREAIEGHIDWHRDTMTADARAGSARRIAVTAVIVAAVSGLASWASVITVIVLK